MFLEADLAEIYPAGRTRALPGDEDDDTEDEVDLVTSLSREDDEFREGGGPLNLTGDDGESVEG